jgi:hypothetical protein
LSSPFIKSATILESSKPTLIPISIYITGIIPALKTLYKIKDVVVKPDLSNIIALRDNIKDESLAVKSAYSVGLVSRNEGRRRLGYPPLDEDKFLEPLNITGNGGGNANNIGSD